MTGLDAWERYGTLAAEGRTAELLAASRQLLAQGHPEANVIHAVALVLERRFEEARSFAERQDQTIEGTWPTLIASIASAGLKDWDRVNVSDAWIEFLQAKTA